MGASSTTDKHNSHIIYDITNCSHSKLNLTHLRQWPTTVTDWSKKCGKKKGAHWRCPWRTHSVQRFRGWSTSCESGLLCLRHWPRIENDEEGERWPRWNQLKRRVVNTQDLADTSLVLTVRTSREEVALSALLKWMVSLDYDLNECNLYSLIDLFLRLKVTRCERKLLISL